MPILENYAEHPFEFPAPPRQNDEKGFIPGNKQDSVIVPPLRPKMEGDKEIQVPGRATVTKEQLDAMRAHRVAKSWFGRNALVVAADEVKAKG